jgi:hypothetical protein
MHLFAAGWWYSNWWEIGTIGYTKWINDQYCHVLLTGHGVWIGNWIYWICTFCGNSESLTGVGSYDFCLLPRFRELTHDEAVTDCAKCTRGLLRRCLRHSFGMRAMPRAFPNCTDCISFETSQDRKLAGMSSSTVASSASTWASACHHGHSRTSHVLWTANMLALSTG